MTLPGNVSVFFILVALLLPAATAPGNVSVPPKPRHHVVDLAGIIDNSVEKDLNRYLLELEQKTAAQMVVLTIVSLEGESIEDVSIDIAHNQWKLGQKGRDNGVLLLISLNDRRYRFEIGYGLEGILPDSLVGSIGRNNLVPYFRKGDYSSGIFAASLAVINEIAADAAVEISGMPKLRNRAFSQQRAGKGKPSIIGTIFSILFFLGLVYLFIKNPRLLLFLLMFSMIGGGRRSGWGGGGGFGGGGGGFGGGGGGGFGGGGSSGGW